MAVSASLRWYEIIGKIHSAIAQRCILGQCAHNKDSKSRASQGTRELHIAFPMNNTTKELRRMLALFNCNVLRPLEVDFYINQWDRQGTPPKARSSIVVDMGLTVYWGGTLITLEPPGDFTSMRWKYKGRIYVKGSRITQYIEQ